MPLVMQSASLILEIVDGESFVAGKCPAWQLPLEDFGNMVDVWDEEPRNGGDPNDKFI